MAQVTLPAETDDRIVGLLQQDADLTYKELAKKLRLKESTVRKRVLSLKKRGVIRRILAQVDPKLLGYRVQAGLGINVDPSMMVDLGKKIVQMSETRMVLSTTGEYDFFTVVWARDRDSLSTIMSSVSNMEGVTKVVPSLLVERLK